MAEERPVVLVRVWGQRTIGVDDAHYSGDACFCYMVRLAIDDGIVNDGPF